MLAGCWRIVVRQFCALPSEPSPIHIIWKGWPAMTRSTLGSPGARIASTLAERGRTWRTARSARCLVASVCASLATIINTSANKDTSLSE